MAFRQSRGQRMGVGKQYPCRTAAGKAAGVCERKRLESSAPHDDGLLRGGMHGLCQSRDPDRRLPRSRHPEMHFSTPHMPPSPEAGMGALGAGRQASSLKAVTVFPWARRGGLQTRGLENKRAVSGRMWRGETSCSGRVSVGDATFQGARCWAEDVACSRSVLGGSFVQQRGARRVLGAGNSTSFALV